LLTFLDDIRTDAQKAGMLEAVANRDTRKIFGLNICNGNRIDDQKPCENSYCQLFNKCKHKPLKP
jgi:hypothetical protein